MMTKWDLEQLHDRNWRKYTVYQKCFWLTELENSTVDEYICSCDKIKFNLFRPHRGVGEYHPFYVCKDWFVFETRKNLRSKFSIQDFRKYEFNLGGYGSQTILNIVNEKLGYAHIKGLVAYNVHKIHFREKLEYEYRFSDSIRFWVEQPRTKLYYYKVWIKLYGNYYVSYGINEFLRAVIENYDEYYPFYCEFISYMFKQIVRKCSIKKSHKKICEDCLKKHESLKDKEGVYLATVIAEIMKDIDLFTV